jgi:CheY-like chemotaxis protein
MSTTTTLQTPEFYSSSTGSMRRAKSIMLVDDEPALRTVGKAILSTFDVPVLTASSGEDCLAALHAGAQQGALPDIILLDLTMPGGMSGVETLDQIQDHFPGIAVIACSGFFGDGADEVCQRLGFADSLPKPYTPDALAAVVRRVMMRLQGDL